MTDDDRDRRAAELDAMQRNHGRFGVEYDNKRNLSRVVDLMLQPPTPLSDWMDHAVAMALRDDYYTGRRTA